jgi:hypothetical protein
MGRRRARLGEYRRLMLHFRSSLVPGSCVIEQLLRVAELMYFSRRDGVTLNSKAWLRAKFGIDGKVRPVADFTQQYRPNKLLPLLLHCFLLRVNSCDIA